jgi:hypothetical protein
MNVTSAASTSLFLPKWQQPPPLTTMWGCRRQFSQ